MTTVPSSNEKEPGDTGSEKELGVSSAYLSRLDNLPGSDDCLFEGQAIEAPNCEGRPRQEFVTRPAVSFEVGFVVYSFISLGVLKVQSAVLRVGEIVLSNPHVLRAGVVKPARPGCSRRRTGTE